MRIAPDEQIIWCRKCQCYLYSDERPPGGPAVCEVNCPYDCRVEGGVFYSNLPKEGR